MRVRTFRGKTMADALDKVKRHFGRGAVILSTKAPTRGGLFGFGGKGFVEITAAKAMADLPADLRSTKLKRGPGRTQRCQSTSRVGLDPPDHAEGAASRVSPISNTFAPRSSDVMLSEIGALKTVVADLVRETRRVQAASIPEALYDTYLRLVQNEVAEIIAQRLIDQVRGALTPDQLQNPETVRTHLARGLEAMLPVAGPVRILPVGQPTIIALVGPTGVGKTTTIAKLAANFHLRERRKVGLITIDTYRIAAVEQLKTYAQIIEVPLEVAMSPAGLKEAVARMADRDLILIDTAGRSQRDLIKVKELRGFFRAVTPHEVHLVLSGTSGEAVLTEAIERFAEVGIDRVIFTKLDEAIGFGVILTCLDKAKAKLSYVTTGQDVPDDISVGEGEALAALILDSSRPATRAGEARGDVSRTRERSTMRSRVGLDPPC